MTQRYKFGCATISSKAIETFGSLKHHLPIRCSSWAKLIHEGCGGINESLHMTQLRRNIESQTHKKDLFMQALAKATERGRGRGAFDEGTTVDVEHDRNRTYSKFLIINSMLLASYSKFLIINITSLNLWKV